MDGDYNDPLIGANVVLNTGIGASSNLECEYSFSIDPGSYTVEFKYVTFEEAAKAKQKLDGHLHQLSLALKNNL